MKSPQAVRPAGKPSKSGWFQKGSEDRKKWQKRWLEIHGHQLLYTSKEGKEAEGMLDLHGVLECKFVAAEGKIKNIVVLRTKLREWAFSADTEAQAKDWQTALSGTLAALDKEHALIRLGIKDEDGGGEEVNALEELPEEAKVLVRAMGFTKEQLSGPKEFPVLLNVLGFQVGRKFVSKKFPNPYTQGPVSGGQYTTDALNAGRRWVQETLSRTFEKTYKLGDKLGEGGYGIVYRAQAGKDKKNMVAIKKSENKDEKARATNLRELYYLMTLESPSIVKCFDCYDMKEFGQMWAVLEFMDGGTLTQARRNHDWIPSEVAYIAQELLTAVAFVHSKQVIHRDIKSANVMFSCAGEVKLIDLGLATNFPEPGQKLKGMIGSPFWISPEMIRGLNHDHKTDIWSSCMCLFELVNKHVPHFDETGEKYNDKGAPGAKGARALFLMGTGVSVPYVNPDLWKDPDALNFFAQMQSFDPATRPEAAVLLKHPYLKQAATKDAIKKMLIKVFQGAALAMF